MCQTICMVIHLNVWILSETGWNHYIFTITLSLYLFHLWIFSFIQKYLKMSYVDGITNHEWCNLSQILIFLLKWYKIIKSSQWNWNLKFSFGNTVILSNNTHYYLKCLHFHKNAHKNTFLDSKGIFKMYNCFEGVETFCMVIHLKCLDFEWNGMKSLQYHNDIKSCLFNLWTFSFYPMIL